jgi:hypothetical protein
MMASEKKKCPCGHPDDMHVSMDVIKGKLTGGCAMLVPSKEREKSHLVAYMVPCDCERVFGSLDAAR